ncbi:MAG: hypothetical protein KF805_12210 [Phycisphaeraceae bacterium]|nr:hypothetical protein [Phycisphaeraceae bacterium]
MTTPSAGVPPAYFDSQKLPPAGPRYVCWLDMVGAANAMKLSLPRAANFIAKIHVAGQRAKDANINVYPAIDGVYAVASRRDHMTDFLRRAYLTLAETFMKEPEQINRFLVRCGLAFGPIVEGASMAKGAPELSGNASYSNGLAVGSAISNAYDAERGAPFFGVFVHESARAFAPSGDQPISFALWRWLNPAVKADATYGKAIGKELEKYFTWVESNAATVLFPVEKLPAYRKLTGEYFV